MAERQLQAVDMSQPAVLDTETLKKVFIDGDLSGLNETQLMDYNRAVCDALDIDWRTQPFAYLKLNNKLVLYAKKDCTDQLRAKRNVSVYLKQREVIEGCYVVTAEARLPNGRVDSSTGVVALPGGAGEVKANAMMKAETKAKRRATLSICGLGMLDESETDSIPGAQTVDVRETRQDAPHASIAANTSHQPTGKLTREDAAKLLHDIEEAGCDGDWVKAYLRSQGFKGLGEMTKREGDVMYRTAVNHRAAQYAEAQPTPGTPAGSLFDEDELAALNNL